MVFGVALNKHRKAEVLMRNFCQGAVGSFTLIPPYCFFLFVCLFLFFFPSRNFSYILCLASLCGRRNMYLLHVHLAGEVKKEKGGDTIKYNM